MPITIPIVAPCPACGQEAALSHEMADGEILLTPPVFFVECAAPGCRRKYKVTLRVDVELLAKNRKEPVEYTPLKISEG